MTAHGRMIGAYGRMGKVWREGKPESLGFSCMTVLPTSPPRLIFQPMSPHIFIPAHSAVNANFT